MRFVGLTLFCLTVAQNLVTTSTTAAAPTRKPKKTAQVKSSPPTFAPFVAGFSASASASATFAPQASFPSSTQFPATTFPQSTTFPQTSFSSALSLGSSNINAAWQNLFDPNQFRSYNMDISPTNLALMNQDPKKELKVSCSVTTDYQTPSAKTYSSPNLGCGYKGSVGALRICFDVRGKFSPDDCRKASYKIDANYFNKQAGDSIAGVHRLMFHGAPADWSMMGERLAFELLHGWGVLAPSATHASLYQNGQFLGVFVFVSPIDDIFTQKYFANDFNQGKGALYKEAWFNPVHMATLAETHYAGKNENAFMNQIQDAVTSTPLDKQSATQFFNTYFDVDSIINVTAANTVLGDTDDWRQRHNLYWYIREDSKGKKAVLIPWDYDRLNDPGADQRGALKGRAWWDPSTRTNCNNPLRTAAARGAIKGGTDPLQVAYWTDVFLATPPDVEQPVSCDKITQLMALALGTQIRQRTREFAATINRATMQANLQTWTSQIQSALTRDPDGPRFSDMSNEQRLLLDAIVNSAQKAVTQANAGDSGISLPSPASSSSSTATFVPKAAASSGGTYKVGEVLSSTFTPVNPAFASAFAGRTTTTTSGGYVPKGTGYTPPTPSFSSFQFQPAATTTTTSQFSQFSQPAAASSSFTFPSSSSFSSTSSFSGSWAAGR